MNQLKERIELGCYTKMSKMYGITSVEEYIDEATARDCKSLGIADINSVQNFITAQTYLERKEIKDFKLVYGLRINFVDDKIMNKKGESEVFSLVIYVKEQVGLKNLYTLLSKAYTNTSDNNPVVFKSQLNKYREGLLYGTVGYYGELYRKIYLNKSNKQIENAAKYYDFIELEPAYNCDSEKEKNEVLKINTKILEIGNKFNILVIASSNCKFINKEDKICNEILNCYNKVTPVETDNSRYMHTTKELLSIFEYLGEEKAYEIVINNTNILSDSCNKINTLVDDCYYPKIENSDKIIKEKTYKKAHELYGDLLPKQVEYRLKLELDSILNNNYESIYVLASSIVKKSNDEGYLVGTRGCVGNSFVAFLLGITQYNPLDYDLPFETFSGEDFSNQPDIDLNFSGEIQDTIHHFVREKFGKDKVFYKGTIGSLWDKTVADMIEIYVKDFDMQIEKNKKNEILKKLIGIKSCTGIHPGGIYIVPEGHEIAEFTPIEKDKYSNKIKTHFDNLNNLYRFDILAHDTPTILNRLQKITGINLESIKLDDKKVLDLFLNKSLKSTTKGIPEFETKYVIDMLQKIKPKNFNDLVCINGLSHGTGIWQYNAESLIKDKIASINEIISNIDDLMNYLINHGIDRKLAYEITTFIRKGKASIQKSQNNYTQEIIEDMKVKWNEYKLIMGKHNISKWYIKSCEQIKYLFPKAYSIGYTIDAFRIAWYKVYYPEAFYKTYFEIQGTIDINKYRSIGQVKRKINFLKDALNDEWENHRRRQGSSLQQIIDFEVLLEMFERGIKKNIEYKKRCL